jgi:hypothetical protein
MAITTPGVVDYHLASQSGSLSISGLAPVTLMTWINTSWTTGGTISMVGTYNTATSGGTAIQIGTKNGAGSCDVWTWGGGQLVGTDGLVTLTNNVWVHIAYTYDGTTHKIYVNGQYVNSGTTAQQAGTITAVYINGYPTGGTSETGTFSVDDVSYFNRPLSADEVLTAYTTAGDKDGLVYGNNVSFVFDEGFPGATANNVLDQTGNGNNLTPIGTAVGVNFIYSASYITGDSRPVMG